MRIAVIGSINMDHVLKVKNLPKEGETIFANSFSLCGGGKGANQAIAAKRLGANVDFIGALSTDSIGDKLLNLLEIEGINTQYIERVSTPSGVAMINVSEKGKNTIVVYEGANADVTKSVIDKNINVIKKSDLIILQLEIPMDTVVYAAKCAKELGKKVILNPAPARELPDELLKYIDYITPNETELAAITGENDYIKGVNILLNRGIGAVIVTLGEQGCFYCSKLTKIKIEAMKVNAIDTTAAGDSYNGALAVAILEGKKIKKCLKFANIVGALTTTKEGAQKSLPLRREVEKFINF